MATAPLRPDEVFRELKSWWELHDGFGLAYVFSTDLVSMAWLGRRIEEALQAPSPGSPGLQFVSHFGQQAADLLEGLALRHRSLHWVPLQSSQQAAWLKTLNENRQALIHSGHLFVLWVDQADVNEVDALAPDLWSVRSWVHLAAPRAGRSSIEQHVSMDWGAGTPALAPHAVPTPGLRHPLPATIAQWQSSFAAWQGSPPALRKRLSPTLARRAAEDARHLRRFDLAQTLLEQAVHVAGEQAQAIEQAHALLSLGDLQSRLGAVDEARDLYTQAIGLYEKEQDDAGLAYTHTEMAALYDPQSNQAVRHAALATRHAQRSQLPPVIEWVTQRSR